MCVRRSPRARSLSLGAVLGAIGAILAACSAAPTEAEILEADLGDRTWRSTTVLLENGFDRDLWPLAPGTRIVAPFEDGTVRVDTGCTEKSIEFIDEEWEPPDAD